MFLCTSVKLKCWICATVSYGKFMCLSKWGLTWFRVVCKGWGDVRQTNFCSGRSVWVPTPVKLFSILISNRANKFQSQTFANSVMWSRETLSRLFGGCFLHLTTHNFISERWRNPQSLMRIMFLSSFSDCSVELLLWIMYYLPIALFLTL